MKTLKLLVLLTLSIFVNNQVFAQAQQVGTVDHLVVHWNGADISKFDVSLTGAITNPTSECDTGRF